MPHYFTAGQRLSAESFSITTAYFTAVRRLMVGTVGLIIAGKGFFAVLLGFGGLNR